MKKQQKELLDQLVEEKLFVPKPVDEDLSITDNLYEQSFGEKTRIIVDEIFKQKFKEDENTNG